MAYNPQMRASDTDRDRVASLLREHHAQGRLTAVEFNERLDLAFGAATVGQLDRLLADLPGIDLYRLPDAALTRYPRPPGAPRRRRGSTGWRVAWGIWFTVSLLCVVIWVLTGANYPWPLWVAGPWGAVLAGTWATVAAVRDNRPQLEQGHNDQLPSADRDLPGRPGS